MKQLWLICGILSELIVSILALIELFFMFLSLESKNLLLFTLSVISLVATTLFLKYMRNFIEKKLQKYKK